MSTSPSAGRPAPRRGCGNGDDAKGCPTTGSCGMRTTSRCWWPAPVTIPRRCGSRSPPCWPPSACGCRRRRPPSATSTRALSSWVAHPAPPAARQSPEVRLHLSLPQGPCGGEGQGAGDHRTDHQPAVGGRAAPAQLGAARLGQLFPSRGVGQDVRLPGRLQLASGDALAVPQAPTHRLAGAVPPLDAGLATHRGDGHPVDPGTVAIHRYRYRGAAIPSPWTA